MTNENQAKDDLLAIADKLEREALAASKATAALSDYDNDKGEIAPSLRELVARWGTPNPITEELNDE